MDGASITYASSKDWLDIMKNRSKVRMHELIERLGLRAKWSSNKRGKTNFESALVRELVADMGDVVATLPKESDELMRFLGTNGSLHLEVDLLLEKYGERVWGRTVDRDHLIAANEPDIEEGVYPRDLFSDNQQDRDLIRKLLHWWIGLKACNVILARERLDRERRKKAESRQALADIDFSTHNDGTAPASFVALAPNSVLHETDPASRASSMSSAALLTPSEPGESPLAGPHEGTAFVAMGGNSNPFTTANLHRPAPLAQRPLNLVQGSWSRPAGAPHPHRDPPASWPPPHPLQPVEGRKEGLHGTSSIDQAAYDREISVEIARLVTSFQPNGAASGRTSQFSHGLLYRGLDYDTLRALRSYIYEETSGVEYDEEALLNCLEKAWREGIRADHDRIVENIPVFIARERAFLTWIELKRHLAALERADKRWRTEGHSTAEIERRIQQHRTLMGATKTLLAAFGDIGQGLGYGSVCKVDRDELLRQAVVVLAGEKYAVEMQWKPIGFSGLVTWLGEHLESFRQEEEEDGRGVLWYMD